jgi:hypothetical protein
MKNTIQYIEKLGQVVYQKISVEINENSRPESFDDCFVFHISDTKSANFQRYYFQTIKNEELFLNSADFFRQFKTQYSLQGIDNNFLDKLEKDKTQILELIRENKLSQLYYDFFYKAKLKHGDGFKEKDLGSFFAKLVHTFNPDNYCALDNPIKDYFGLSKESFFISFQIISKNYAYWGNQHLSIVNELKKRLKKIDRQNIINQEKLTDLKLLDLIFWSKANKPK